jgi:6-phosphogluconolactonase
VYCLTEHSHEIYFYNKDLEFVKKYQTVDKQTAGIASAAIRMTRDQKHLYISNRGYDSITHFLINEDGTLKQKRIYPSQGKHPRDFNISLDESHIVVGNMHSNNVAIFSRDETTGDLKFIKTLPVPEPSCIIFIS